jgi:mono/diheme cytochrome c family protein
MAVAATAAAWTLMVSTSSAQRQHSPSILMRSVDGAIFRALESPEARAGIHIDHLVDVERWQQPPTATEGLGARLFVTHCATCHGRDGRGGGIMTGELRHTPPDLTRFTARNGGVFPRERINRIIEGREVAAHGDRDMPIWGDAFNRTNETRGTDTKTRITAIVDFLEAIQQRGAE